MSLLETSKLPYRNINTAMAKSQNSYRFIGYKEWCFNTASKIVGCNAKQCCYACAGLSEKPLYTNDKIHSYLYVAICEGHVKCLDKIVGYVIKKINTTNYSLVEKEDIKRRYLQKIYMSLIEINNDFEKRYRMIQLLRKYGFFIDNSEDGKDASQYIEDREDTYRF